VRQLRNTGGAVDRNHPRARPLHAGVRGAWAPPRAIWLETLVAECLERLESSGRFEELSVLSDEASRLRSITVPKRYVRTRSKPAQADRP
jgi:hypothetical protein